MISWLVCHFDNLDRFPQIPAGGTTNKDLCSNTVLEYRAKIKLTFK